MSTYDRSIDNDFIVVIAYTPSLITVFSLGTPWNWKDIAS
jgi:hypothetical protein